MFEPQIKGDITPPTKKAKSDHEDDVKDEPEEVGTDNEQMEACDDTDQEDWDSRIEKYIKDLEEEFEEKRVKLAEKEEKDDSWALFNE